MNNKLTLQINSLEALERLIGGDSQVEIDIRNSVVQKFAERHLKPLANAPEITSTIQQIKQEILKQVSDKLNKEVATFNATWNGSITDVKLHPAIKSEIDRNVKSLTEDTIRKSVEEAVKAWSDDSNIKSRIENRFEYYTNQLINDEIKKRLEKVKAAL